VHTIHHSIEVRPPSVLSSELVLERDFVVNDVPYLSAIVPRVALRVLQKEEEEEKKKEEEEEKEGGGGGRKRRTRRRQKRKRRPSVRYIWERQKQKQT